MPRDSSDLTDHMCAGVRATVRTAMLEPLAPLRAQQRVVVRAGAFPRTERRCDPLQPPRSCCADGTGSFNAR